MKLAIATISALIAFAPTKIDPLPLLNVSSSSSINDTQHEAIIATLGDAQAFRDLESEIINMPSGSNLTPASILALIESHRTTNRKHYRNLTDKDRNNLIHKALKDRQMTLLEANKAIKKAKYLEDEVERLRKKLEGKDKPSRRN